MAEGKPEDTCCSFCQQLLTIGPIYKSAKIYVCGKCVLDKPTSTEKSSLKRYERLEEILGIKEFYCMYRIYGCPEEVNPVVQHEYMCLYRQVRCPYYFMNLYGHIEHGCEWLDCARDFNTHVKRLHAEYILKPASFSVSEHSTMFFVHVRGHVFTVIILVISSKIYKVNVFCIGSTKDVDICQFQVMILNNIKGKEKTIFLRKHNVASLFLLENYLKDLEEWFKIDLEELKMLVGRHNCLVGKIGIVLKSKNMIRGKIKLSESVLLKPAKNEEVVRVDNEMFTEISCQYCKLVLFPPIFMCDGGHSVCKRCHPPTLDNPCPQCEKKMSKTRNFILEHIIATLTIPCPYNPVGCIFMGTYGEIETHRMTCKYRPCE